jgi:hypothetical protein
VERLPEFTTLANVKGRFAISYIQLVDRNVIEGKALRAGDFSLCIFGCKINV